MSKHRSTITDDEDTMAQDKLPLWIHRLLVIALYLSGLACLLAIWFSGTLFSNASQILPLWLLREVTDHRVSILGASCACLLIWYAMLRHVTGDIMAVPERYLDERQKMVRDQAHRSAFTLVKLLCCLIPLLLLTQYFLPRHPTPAPVSAVTVEVAQVQPIQWDTVVIPGSKIGQPSHLVLAAQTLKQLPHALVGVNWLRSVNAKPFSVLTIHQLTIRTPPIVPFTPVAPASTAEIALAVGALLLCLYLLFSALPMSVIAWKRRL